MKKVLRLGVVGDLHGAFEPADVTGLDAKGYARLIFVGDLGTGTLATDRRVARAMARLATPLFVMPGNNDCAHAPMLRAELGHGSGMAELLRESGARHRSSSVGASGDVVWCGYSRHRLDAGGWSLTVVAGRPYAMGGETLSFADELALRYGVRSMEESIDRLVALVDEVDTEAVLFLGHNGPTGLGAERDALWGSDFRDGEGDHGDPDLAAAIAHAKARGLAVLGVVAGHMHHRLRGGGMRRWSERRDDTLYVNPARVPRIVHEGGSVKRHHVALAIHPHRMDAEEIWVVDPAERGSAGR